MTRLTVLTHRLEVRVRMVRPNIRRLHSSISLLTICDSIYWNILHPTYFTHTSTRILDEVILRIQLLNKFQHVSVHFVTFFSLFGLGRKITIVFSMSVSGYCSNAISSAVRGRSEERRVGKECRCRGWRDV